MHPLRIALVAPLLIAFGCAPLRPQIAYESYGLAHPTRDRRVIERALDTSTPLDTSSVRVLVSTYPPGIEVKGDIVRTRPGFHHRILGKFHINASSAHAPFWFWDYRQPWRKGYCYWQVPLAWLTLTLWAYFVPFAWPCFPRSSMTEVEMLHDVRRLAASAGGDLAVITVFRARPDVVGGVNGVIIKADPRYLAGRLEGAHGAAPPEGSNLRPGGQSPPDPSHGPPPEAPPPPPLSPPPP